MRTKIQSILGFAEWRLSLCSFYFAPADNGRLCRNFYKVNRQNKQISICRFVQTAQKIPKTDLIHAPPYASYPIAGRKRQCGPEFPSTRPYANFSRTSAPFVPICKFPELQLAGRLLDKNKKICYNVKKTLL